MQENKELKKALKLTCCPRGTLQFLYNKCIQSFCVGDKRTGGCILQIYVIKYMQNLISKLQWEKGKRACMYFSINFNWDFPAWYCLLRTGAGFFLLNQAKSIKQTWWKLFAKIIPYSLLVGSLFGKSFLILSACW